MNQPAAFQILVTAEPVESKISETKIPSVWSLAEVEFKCLVLGKSCVDFDAPLSMSAIPIDREVSRLTNTGGLGLLSTCPGVSSPVPAGQCWGCRPNASSNWSFDSGCSSNHCGPQNYPPDPNPILPGWGNVTGTHLLCSNCYCLPPSSSISTSATVLAGSNSVPSTPTSATISMSVTTASGHANQGYTCTLYQKSMVPSGGT
jgi:hypothetical protein